MEQTVYSKEIIKYKMYWCNTANILASLRFLYDGAKIPQNSLSMHNKLQLTVAPLVQIFSVLWLLLSPGVLLSIL